MRKYFHSVLWMTAMVALMTASVPARAAGPSWWLRLGTGTALATGLDRPWSGYVGVVWSLPRNHALTFRAVRIVDLADADVFDISSEATPVRNIWDIAFLYGRRLTGTDRLSLSAAAGIAVVRFTDRGGLLPDVEVYRKTESAVSLPLEAQLDLAAGSNWKLGLLLHYTANFKRSFGGGALVAGIPLG